MHNRAPTKAAMSSSLGRVKFLSGATRALAITNEELVLLQTKTTAPYTLRLASTNVRSTSCLLGSKLKYFRGKHGLEVCFNS